MRYVTITTWEIDDKADFDLVMERVRQRRVPALRELGAERVQILRTSDRTIAAVSEWPNKTIRDEAEEWIEKVRKDVRQVDQGRLTGEMRGEVVAEA
ncbi:hypothetical protein ILP92_14105 [Maribius pontilimi]|uniref:ABM domain-containing protein n=1 Tax=Palleronia pontilimi TaxID=1964209 RepID=A0A934IGC3_9RHOB|nr:hypothetical protein [Palleronia pontilimi]MBJ3763882.1 hypothetical protein [Palleronia pontilimi]